MSSSEQTPDDLDRLSWGADDLGALTYFLGAYAYMAAEQMTDELLEALGIAG